MAFTLSCKKKTTYISMNNKISILLCKDLFRIDRSQIKKEIKGDQV